MRRLLFWLLLAYSALLPFERFWRVISASATDSIFKPYRIVGLFMLALWVPWSLASRREIKLDTGDKCFLGLFAWGVVMALFWHMVEGNDLGYTGHAAQLIFFGFAMYTLTKKLRLSGREIGLLLSAYIGGLFTSVAWSLTLSDELSGRMRGLQNNPNQLGIAAGIGFVFVFAQFVFLPRPRLFWQVARVLTAVTTLALIGLSGSRGAAFGTLIGATVLLLITFGMKRRGQPSSGRGLRVLGFTALCLALIGSSYDRFETAWEQTDSRTRFQQGYAMQTAGERWDLWRSGWNVGVEHFGMGVGMMQYFTYHVASVKALRGKTNSNLEDHVLGTHSDYVDLFACYGIVGVGLFAYYVSTLLRTLGRQLREPDDDERAAYLRPLALAMLAFTLVFQISQNSFAWCDYYMVIAVIETVIRLPMSSSAAATELRTKPARVAPFQRKQLPAFGRNQALVHDHGGR